MNRIVWISVIGLLAALLLPATVAGDMGPDPELREILRAAASESDSFPDRFEPKCG
jgi:hypothetical protein